MGVVLDRGQPERPAGTAQGAQGALAGQHAGKARVLGRDQDPVLAAAVAAKLHVVSAAGALMDAWRAGRRADIRARALAVGFQRAVGGVAQAHAIRPCEQRLYRRHRAIVERHERTPDRWQAVGVGVLEQDAHGPRGGVGGEGQPPVLVGSGKVDEALPEVAPRALAFDRAGELTADVRLGRQTREQQRERLASIWVQRNAPRPRDRIPAPAGNRAQQLAQALVVGEAQDGLLVFQVC